MVVRFDTGEGGMGEVIDLQQSLVKYFCGKNTNWGVTTNVVLRDG